MIKRSKVLEMGIKKKVRSCPLSLFLFILKGNVQVENNLLKQSPNLSNLRPELFFFVLIWLINWQIVFSDANFTMKLIRHHFKRDWKRFVE